MREPFARKNQSWTQKILRQVDALSNRFGRASAIAPHLKTGLRGEEEAFFFLRRQGYVVVARRWRTPKVPGDVDLIGWDGDTLCFIEVKTRTKRDIVPAEFAVDAQKQKMMRSMASVYRKRLPESAREQTRIRFDVVSVYMSVAGYMSAAGTGSASDLAARAEVELFRGAFGQRED